MVSRRQGREWAAMMLVQFDLNPPDSIDEAIDAFWRQQAELEAERIADGEARSEPVFGSKDERTLRSLEEVREFTEERVRGVVTDCDSIDACLVKQLENWSLYRLGTVERNVLRMGAWELLNRPDIPAPIIINESVDVTKYFSATSAGRFVNGVLDRLAKLHRSIGRESGKAGK